MIRVSDQPPITVSTKEFNRVFGSLVQRLLPELCPRCGLISDTGFCLACRSDFPWILEACAACGLPEPGHDCPARGANWRLAGVRVPFSYEPPVDQPLNDLKFRRQRSLGRAFGLVLAEWLSVGVLASRADALVKRAEFLQEIDAIVAVPLHRSRLRLRGFNQADEIARTVAAALELPQLVTGIARTAATEPQSKLDQRSRQSNIRGAFSVRRDLTGLRIALVDDVMTTGATMNELAACMQLAGADRIEAWAVARTI